MAALKMGRGTALLRERLDACLLKPLDEPPSMAEDTAGPQVPMHAVAALRRGCDTTAPVCLHLSEDLLCSTARQAATQPGDARMESGAACCVHGCCQPTQGKLAQKREQPRSCHWWALPCWQADLPWAAGGEAAAGPQQAAVGRPAPGAGSFLRGGPQRGRRPQGQGALPWSTQHVQGGALAWDP